MSDGRGRNSGRHGDGPASAWGARRMTGQARAETGRTVVISTYCRGDVVADTAERLLGLEDPPDAVILVDQTPAHLRDVETRLMGFWGVAIRPLATALPAGGPAGDECRCPPGRNRGGVIPG